VKNLAKPVIGLLALAFAWASSPPAAQAQLEAYNPEATDSPLTVSALFRYLEGATIAVLLHEIGHAMIDVYDLPIVASEEDAADEFATISCSTSCHSFPETGGRWP